ncbi:MAG: hypothetical protein ACXWNK_08995 [Vulcanimicrobiaceae bacterium]
MRPTTGLHLCERAGKVARSHALYGHRCRSMELAMCPLDGND